MTKATNFADDFLKFKPMPYQDRLLENPSNCTVVICPRQSCCPFTLLGKSTTLAARMILYAATDERRLSLIVAPSLPQSVILMDRMHALLMGMARRVRREDAADGRLVQERLTDRSAPELTKLLRGHTAHQVLCDGTFGVDGCCSGYASEDALMTLAWLSRGIFRRFQRYIMLTVIAW